MGWRALFWTASGISVLLRALLPESAVFLKASASSGTARKISLPDRPIHSFPTGRNRRWRVHGVAPAVLGAVYHNCRFTSLTAVFTPSGSYPRASARSPPAPSAYSSARDVIPIHLVEMAPPACRATCPAARKHRSDWRRSSAGSGQSGRQAGDGARLHEGAGNPHRGRCSIRGVRYSRWAREPRLGSHFEKHRAGFGEGGGADDTHIDDEGVHHAAGRAERDAEKASEERSSTEKPVA